jgi:hypothetical protein
MSWMFVRHIAFYALLGMILFIPLVFLIAAFRKKDFKGAYVELKNFLEKWAVVAKPGLMKIIFNVAGISTVLVLLGFGAYYLNRIGDTTMPITSAWVSHFNNELVRWSIEHKDDEWSNMKFNYREITEIRGDRLKWEEAKVRMGKIDVRFFRIIFFCFLLLLIAGTRDLFSRTEKKPKKEVKYINRAIGLLLIAIIGLIISQWLWVERQWRYVDNLLAQYRSEYKHKHDDKEPEFPPELNKIYKKAGY